MKPEYRFLPALLLICIFTACGSETPGQRFIQIGQQSPELRESSLLPTANQTMNQVKELLGEPEQQDSVGKPLISRWFYKHKTVYFQDGRVIRTVVLEDDIHPVESAR